MTGSRDRAEKLLLSPAALPLLFLLFLAGRLLVVCIDVAPTSDAEWYFNRAVGMARGDGYAEGGRLTAFWPPGYPMALSVLFRVFGPSVLVGKLFNLACAMVTAWLTLDLGRRIFRSEAAARLGLLALAIYPNSIAYMALLLTEPFFTMLMLAGCWTMLACRGAVRVVATGVLLGVATLVKAQSLVLIPMLFGLVLLQDRITVRRFVSASTAAAVTLLVCSAVVFPWSYRNHTVFGTWIPVSTNGGLTLLTGNNPSAQGDYTPEDPLVTSIPRTVDTQVEVDREAKRRAVAWIGEHPSTFVGLIPKKIFRLWAPDGEGEWFYQRGHARYDDRVFLFRAVRYANQAYYLALMLAFAVAGIVLASNRARREATLPGWRWLPFLVALFPTLIGIVFSGQSRFHYPVMPLVAMTVGWLLASASPLRRGAAPVTA